MPVPSDSENELLGLAGRAGAIPSSLVETTLIPELREDPEFHVNLAPPSRGNGTITLAAGPQLAAVVAAARILIGDDLQLANMPEAAGATLLRTHTRALEAGYPEPELRDLLVAVASMRSGTVDGSAAALRQALSSAREDASRRRSLVLLAVERLRLSPKKAEQVICNARAAWEREVEPEIRYSLGELVLEASSGLHVSTAACD